MAPTAGPIVLRGDLYSDTGYGRATRALAGILRGEAGRIFGVSLHEHHARRQNAVDFPVLADAELANPLFRGATIINICLPDSFVRVTGATNIGYFFWETDSTPPVRFWRAQMMKMDRLWAPSRWQSDYLRKITGRAEIPVIPWPMEEGSAVPASSNASLLKIRAHSPMSPAQLDNFLLRCAPPGTRVEDKQREESEHARGHSSRYDPSRASALVDHVESQGDLFVAVQTDAPRKGLPLLLASWMRFKASPEGKNANLVIKLSSLDVTADFFRAHFHASLAIHRAASRCGVTAPDVWLIYDRLSSDEMRAFLRIADALVSATLGEGFGGPIAEAFIEGTPVIAPRHTSIQDILCEDYPLAVASKPHNLKLWNNIDVYSAASQWHIVEDESLVAKLKALALMSESERAQIADAARTALFARVGVAAVAETVRRELEAGAARGPDKAPPADNTPAAASRVAAALQAI